MKVSALNQEHPSRDPRLSEYRQLAEGGSLFEPTEWLKQNPVEPNDRYTDRVERALYINECGPLLSMVVDMVHSKPPALLDDPRVKTGRDPDVWAAFQSNVDRKGTAIAQYSHRGLLDAMKAGAVYTLVDMPPTSDAGSMAQQLARGELTPRLGHFTAEHLLWWSTDPDGKKNAFVFREAYTKAEFGVPSVDCWRWTYIDDTVVRTYTAPVDADGSDDAFLEAETPHKQKAAPVAVLELPVAMHAMHRLRDPAVDLLRADNGHRWSTHQSYYAMLFLTGSNVKPPSGGDAGYWMSGPADAKAEWLAPPAHIQENGRKDIERARDNLYRSMRAVNKAAGASGRQAQSAASKEADDTGVQVSLSGFALYLRGWLMSIATIAAERRNETTEGLSVAGLDDWQSEDLTQFLEAVAMSGFVFDMSPTAKKSAVNHAVRLLLRDGLSEAQYAVIEEEVDAFDPLDDVPQPGGFREKPDDDTDEDED